VIKLWKIFFFWPENLYQAIISIYSKQRRASSSFLLHLYLQGIRGILTGNLTSKHHFKINL
jgi:hypothetical protein